MESKEAWDLIKARAVTVCKNINRMLNQRNVVIIWVGVQNVSKLTF